MKPLVEFCKKNFVLGTAKTKKKLKETDHLEVMVNHCLGYCRHCKEIPFALVEGEYVEARDQKQLQLAIEKKAEEKAEYQHALDEIIKKMENN